MTLHLFPQRCEISKKKKTDAVCALRSFAGFSFHLSFRVFACIECMDVTFCIYELFAPLPFFQWQIAEDKMKRRKTKRQKLWMKKNTCHLSQRLEKAKHERDKLSRLITILQTSVPIIVIKWMERSHWQNVGLLPIVFIHNKLAASQRWRSINFQLYANIQNGRQHLIDDAHWSIANWKIGGVGGEVSKKFVLCSNLF